MVHAATSPPVGRTEFNASHLPRGLACEGSKLGTISVHACCNNSNWQRHCDVTFA